MYNIDVHLHIDVLFSLYVTRAGKMSQNAQFWATGKKSEKCSLSPLLAIPMLQIASTTFFKVSGCNQFIFATFK